MPDRSDRDAAAEYAAEDAETFGVVSGAERVRSAQLGPYAWHEPAVQMANQLGMVSARLDRKPRWHERLPELLCFKLLTEMGCIRMNR